VNKYRRRQSTVLRSRWQGAHPILKKASMRISPFVWLMHWATVLSVLLAFLFWMPASVWAQISVRGHFLHDVHVSAGIVALSLVAARLTRLILLRRSVTALRGDRHAKTAQLLSLLAVAFAAVTGLLAVRQPALGMKISFFGVIPAPEISAIVSARVWRTAHAVSSYLLVAIVSIHIILGLRKNSAGVRSPLLTMLWPWFKGKSLRSKSS
jgi:cytochrome b561